MRSFPIHGIKTLIQCIFYMIFFQVKHILAKMKELRNIFFYYYFFVFYMVILNQSKWKRETIQTVIAFKNRQNIFNDIKN